MVSMMALIFAVSRPSEKLGTHSTNCLANLLSSSYCRRGQIHSEMIGYLAIIGGVENGEVSIFALFDGADAGGGANGVRSVYSSRHDRLGRRHFHLRAGERQDH